MSESCDCRPGHACAELQRLSAMCRERYDAYLKSYDLRDWEAYRDAVEALTRHKEEAIDAANE